MNFDFQRITDSKAVHRRKLAALPIAEKVRLLDAMRERALAIHRATRQPDSDSVREEPPDYRINQK